MSKSRRKNPICGITTARSEKIDKRFNHRKFRRLTKQILANLEDEEDLLPIERQYSNPYRMSKDGKMRFDKEKYSELMRK